MAHQVMVVAFMIPTPCLLPYSAAWIISINYNTFPMSSSFLNSSFPLSLTSIALFAEKWEDIGANNSS